MVEPHMELENDGALAACWSSLYKKQAPPPRLQRKIPFLNEKASNRAAELLFEPVFTARGGNISALKSTLPQTANVQAQQEHEGLLNEGFQLSWLIAPLTGGEERVRYSRSPGYASVFRGYEIMAAGGGGGASCAHSYFSPPLNKEESVVSQQDPKKKARFWRGYSVRAAPQVRVLTWHRRTHMKQRKC